MDRKTLYKRICRRTEQMLENGLIEEVLELRNKYDVSTVHPLDSIGYRQVLVYLDEKISRNEMIDDINIRTRQYAKRQFQWFNNEPIDLKIDLTEKMDVEEVAKIVINNFECKAL